MKQMLSWLKWLYPGMRVKRWMTLTLVGMALVVAGIVLAVNITWGDYLQWLDDNMVQFFRVTGLNPTDPHVYPADGLCVDYAGPALNLRFLFPV